MTTKYEIHLDGVSALDLSLGVLRDLADLIIEGASRAVRLAAEGRSTARGTAPIWVSESSDIRVVAFREGSLVMDVVARPLAEVAPTIFTGSGTTEAIVAHGETAFDLLMGAIDDALHGRRDSDRLDFGMLQTLARSRSIFARGATQLRIAREGGQAIEFSEPAVEQFQKLAAETPSPRVDRIVGVLDSLTMSTRTASMKLEDGLSLKGNLSTSMNLDAVKNLLGHEVVVEGIVSFRPSTRPQRVEIDHIDAASGRDVIWKRTPKGELGQQSFALPSEDLGRYFGQWPGEEDDERVFTALRRTD